MLSRSAILIKSFWGQILGKITSFRRGFTGQRHKLLWRKGRKLLPLQIIPVFGLIRANMDQS